jgi:hypothetical protein
MSRARLISPEFRTSEAVVDCAPTTRLLLLGVAKFRRRFRVVPASALHAIAPTT